MTTALNDRSIAYTAVGGETTFGFDFPIQDDDELRVRLIRTSAEITLTIGVDYAVAFLNPLGGAGLPSSVGDITLTTPALAADQYILDGETELERASDLQTRPHSNTMAELNAEFDRLYWILQEFEHAGGDNFVLRFETTFTGTVGRIPATIQAGQFIRRKVGNDGWEAATIVSDGSVQSASETVAGIGEIATTLEAAAGLNDATFLTPLKGAQTYPRLAVANTFTDTQTISVTGNSLQRIHGTISAILELRDTGATDDSEVFQIVDNDTDLTIRSRLNDGSAKATIATMAADGGGYLGAATGGNKGAGTLNATGLYVNGHGTVAQVVRDTEATYTTLGTILPCDNSIPQNTEGDEILSVTITPTNASSTILLIPSVWASEAGIANYIWAIALFVDSTANAIAARASTINTTDRLDEIAFIHAVSAGSTSARTYKARAGGSAATDIFINGDSGSRLLGGVAQCTLTAIEILPQ